MKQTPMRIGIDCRTILNPGLGEAAGVGHYTYFLVRHLLETDKENEYVLFFDNRVPDVSEFEQANSTVWRLPFFQYKRFLPFGYSHMLVAAMLLKNHLDVFHAPANVLPLSYRKTSVVTIHDLAIFRHPEWFPKQRIATRVLVPRTIKKAAHLIAVSQSTADDLRQLMKVPSTKITVVPEAAFVDPINLHDRNVDARTKFGLAKPYLLFVGTVEPRKNLQRLLEAFLRLRNDGAIGETELVVAGGTGFSGDDILNSLHGARAKGVHALGYVSHNEKISLLRSALAFVFPSLYEGFGLPVLEAMSLGVPVVTANISSLPEIAGDAALLIDPHHTESLAQALRQVVNEATVRAQLIERGKKQASHFTWAKAASATLEVYRKTVKTASR